jgi:glutathione synthase/RimK-type ligase-like ATP-grasp enzyme
MMRLVIGSEEEHHAQHIYALLKAKGEAVAYLDSRQLPEALPLAWEASELTPTGFLTIEGVKIPIASIQSVYWRWYYGIHITPTHQTPEAFHTAHMIEREVTSAIESLFTTLVKDSDCLWVNSLNAVEMHKKKGYQLHLMAKHGIRVPQTLITNDTTAAISFYETNHRSVIVKPVRGGASTQKVTETDFSEEKLGLLKYAPVQFQELIEGVDIRVYGVGNQLFAAEIQATTIDFREDPQATIVPITLPSAIQEQCLQVMQLCDLCFTGIDIRRTPEGAYVFIEANPSPMFTFFERQSGYPISDALVNLLINGEL